MVYYHLDKRTNEIKKLSEKAYDKAAEKYGDKSGLSEFHEYVSYRTGQRDFWRV